MTDFSWSPLPSSCLCCVHACARAPLSPNKRDNCSIFARRRTKRCVLTAWQVVIPVKLMTFSILWLHPSGPVSNLSCFQLMKRKALKKKPERTNRGHSNKGAVFDVQLLICTLWFRIQTDLKISQTRNTGTGETPQLGIQNPPVLELCTLSL